MATKKRIAIFAQGSRGDVQPYIALALGFARRGHDVVLAAPDDFAGWIGSFGLSYAAMGTNIQDLLKSSEIRKILAGNPFGIGKVWKSTAIPMLEKSLGTLWEVGQNADILVHHPKVIGAADIAEVTGAPVVLASPIPMMPTSEFPIITMSHDYGKLVNKLTWLPLHWVRIFYGRQLSQWRQQTLGLSRTYRPRNGADPFYGADLRLIGVSKLVVPPPSDWDENTIMTGYWTLPEDTGWRADQRLSSFLDGGLAPIYVGFGSMPVDSPEHATHRIVEAIESAKCRAVLSSGWAGLGDEKLPDSVMAIDNVPHDWLFPRVSGVVHHGGAGTTAAGLIAGRPTLICPAGVDQPFWAGRVAELKCGPRPLRLKDLTAAALTDRVVELCHSTSFVENASALGNALSKEDGVACAVNLIEEKYCL